MQGMHRANTHRAEHDQKQTHTHKSLADIIVLEAERKSLLLQRPVREAWWEARSKGLGGQAERLGVTP